jgi:hypothetical protein
MLSKSSYGKKIIKYYYDNSKSLTELFDEYPILQLPARKILEILCRVLDRL